MARISVICFLALIVSGCAVASDISQNACTADTIESLRTKAWEANEKDDDELARRLFTKLCDCANVEGCINAIRFYDESSKKSRELREKACNLGDGHTCFMLGETLSGDEAKNAYEKGCTFNKDFHADGMACRMAGKMNQGDKQLYYLEKGCELGDEVSCIEVWPMVKADPVKKEKYKKIGCEWGIPELCYDVKRPE
jgi:hypothetical protein